MTPQSAAPLASPERDEAPSGYVPTTRDALVLLLLAIPIAFVSIGAHDLALTRLGIPFPYEHGLPDWARLIGQVSRLAGLTIFAGYAGSHIERMGLVLAAVVFGILNMALTETVRVIAIDFAIYGGTPASLLYSLREHVPAAVFNFFLGACAPYLAVLWRNHRRRLAVAGVLICTTALQFGVLALSKTLMAMVGFALNIKDLPALYSLPFGFHIYKYIYVGFIETTVASFFLLFLVWPSLPGRSWQRIVVYTTLMLLARGRIVAMLLYSFWNAGGRLIELAAEGQFFVETLLFASLTALAWSIMARSRESDVRSNASL